MRLAVILVAGLLSACATPVSNDKAAASAGADKVCKRIAMTGSNVTERVCRTREEWAAIDKQGQAGVSEFERARRGRAGRPVDDVQAVFASARPSSAIIALRISNFWILPVTVIGKESTNFT